MTPEPLDRARTPLLTLVTEQSLEEEYRSAFDRRLATGGGGADRPTRGRALLTVVVVVAVFGLLVSTAFVQTSRSAASADAGRTGLIRRAEAQRDRLEAQQALIARLESRTLRLTRQATATSQAAAVILERVRRLQVRTGFVPVRGEGVRLVVAQASDADEDQSVKDSDLALIANGLWEAGAEAIAVNGQRLTARSAITTGGLAIEINDVGIAPPYTVLAIGDRRTLQSRFVESGSGARVQALANQFGFTVTMENVARLSLPAGPPRLLRLVSASAVPDPATAGRIRRPPAEEAER